MRYLFERYYYDEKLIDLHKLLLTTLIEISNYCDDYKFELISPKKEYKGALIKKGKFPVENKSEFVENLTNWLYENSMVDNLWNIILSDSGLEKGYQNVFEFYDTCWNWSINYIDDNQFEKLQKTLLNASFPEDTFYREDKEIVTKVKGFWGFLGMQKFYSPKAWELEQKKNGTA